MHHDTAKILKIYLTSRTNRMALTEWKLSRTKVLNHRQHKYKMREGGTNFQQRCTGLQQMLLVLELFRCTYVTVGCISWKLRSFHPPC